MKEDFLVITPDKNSLTRIKIREIYKYKDLFYELFSKEIKLRYKQTAIGILWAILQPLLVTLIFTLFFGKLIKVQSLGLPYPVFVFAGLMFWNFFANSLTSASGSLIGNESLIKKVFFPRVIIPLASIFTNLFDLFITSIFFMLFILFYKINFNILLIVNLFLATILAVITAIGAGLFLSALNVKYRDVKQILPFFIQMLIFVTPVIYPVSVFSDKNQWIMSINPLSTSIDMVRLSLLQGTYINPINLTISVAAAITTLLIGVFYFQKTQKYFADLI